MRCLAAVKGSLLHHCHVVVVGKAIQHRRSDAATGGATARQNGIRLQVHQIRRQQRAEKDARLAFANDDVVRPRGDGWRDGVAFVVGAHVLAAAAVFVGPSAGVPAVRARLHARAVEDRDALLARRCQKFRDTVNGLPTLLAAAVAPAAHRVPDRLPPIADEVVVDVDHQHDGPFAQPAAATVARRNENFAIPLSQKTIPNRHGAHDMKKSSSGLSGGQCTLAGYMHAEIMEQLDTAERTRVAIAPLTETRPGLTPSDAYAVQAAWLERKLAAGGQLAGRKIGLTSKAMQQQLGVGEPDFGFLLRSMLVPSGGTLKRADLLQPRVEPEI